MLFCFACALEWKLSKFSFNGRAWEGNWLALIDNCIHQFFFFFFRLVLFAGASTPGWAKEQNISRGSRLTIPLFLFLFIYCCMQKRKE